MTAGREPICLQRPSKFALISRPIPVSLRMPSGRPGRVIISDLNLVSIVLQTPFEIDIRDLGSVFILDRKIR